MPGMNFVVTGPPTENMCAGLNRKEKDWIATEIAAPTAIQQRRLLNYK